MRIRFLGHATFLITTAAGRKVITDPYEPGAFGGAIGLRPISDQADIVTVSHAHADHGDAASLPGHPAVYPEAGQFTVGDIALKGVPTFHDAVRGRERGPNVVWVIGADGMQIAHLGDLGHVIDSAQAESIGPVDILMVPVGGTYTIDARDAIEVVGLLAPHIVIPMHYRVPQVTIALDPVEDFLRDLRSDRSKVIREANSSDLEIAAEDLPKQGMEIVILRPAL